MSPDTLRADPRYQDASRALDQHMDPKRSLHLANPAMMDGRHADRTDELVNAMVALAVDHGWNPDREEWSR